MRADDDALRSGSIDWDHEDNRGQVLDKLSALGQGDPAFACVIADSQGVVVRRSTEPTDITDLDYRKLLPSHVLLGLLPARFSRREADRLGQNIEIQRNELRTLGINIRGYGVFDASDITGAGDIFEVLYEGSGPEAFYRLPLMMLDKYPHAVRLIRGSINY